MSEINSTAVRDYDAIEAEQYAMYIRRGATPEAAKIAARADRIRIEVVVNDYTASAWDVLVGLSVVAAKLELRIEALEAKGGE